MLARLDASAWTFFPQKDQLESDVGFCRGDLIKIRDAAAQQPDCVAFNTWGYLKDKVVMIVD
jgi:hypothetical protein